MTLSAREQIKRDREKATQLVNRAKRLETREKVNQRKKDDHRKFIIGGALQKLAKDDSSIAKQLFEWLNKSVTNRSHRRVLGLDPV